MGAPYIQDKELKKAIKELNKIPKNVNHATARALNDGLVTCGKVAAQETAKEYVIKQADIKSTFKKHRASIEHLEAKINSEGEKLKLSFFPYSPNQTTNKKRKNGKPYASSKVKVRVKRNEGRKVVHHALPAFSNKGIYYRKSKKRFPIQTMFTTSIPGMIENPKVGEIAVEKGSEQAEKRLIHHLERLIGGGK